MENSLVFNDYDMVVSYTEAAINDQLRHLTQNLETISPRLIIYQDETYESGEWKTFYVVCTDSREIPTDREVAYVDVTFIPRMKIVESGYTVILLFCMSAGSAAFWEGRPASLVSYTVKDWTYGLRVDLNLVQVAEDAEKSDLAIPDTVVDQLNAFNSDGFKVSALFMDFQSVELVAPDEDWTYTGEAGDQARAGLNDFMDAYVRNLKEEGNPYVLGYSITATEDSEYDPDENVPDPLKPAATTFSIYYDSGNNDHSNLNYVLATAGGHGAITEQPDWFSDNWFSDVETIHGKMYYSKNVLVELYVLMPIYESLQKEIWTAIEGDLHVDMGNSYDGGKSILNGDDGAAIGYSYIICDDKSGHNIYKNTFSAVFRNLSSGTIIDFKGHIFMRMTDSKDMPLDSCVAEVWSSCSIDWSGTISITATLSTEATGDLMATPILSISDPVIQVDDVTVDSGMNACAKDWAEATLIIGEITTLWGTLGDPTYLTKAVMSGLNPVIEGIGDIGQVFQNLGNSVTNVLVLPAGDTFYFQNPTMDGSGDLCLDLTFKN